MRVSRGHLGLVWHGLGGVSATLTGDIKPARVVPSDSTTEYSIINGDTIAMLFFC